jgi:hypothetical protein
VWFDSFEGLDCAGRRIQRCEAEVCGLIRLRVWIVQGVGYRDARQRCSNFFWRGVWDRMAGWQTVRGPSIWKLQSGMWAESALKQGHDFVSARLY